MSLPSLLAVARGHEPADLLLRRARLINVFTGEIESTEIALSGTRIAGTGEGYESREAVDLDGAYVCPGLIDAHVHVESAMVPPREFAAMVVPHGVTTAVTDPHEIANVLGLEGVRFMLSDAQAAPMSLFANASSCVPATELATTGARLEASQLAELAEDPGVLGLAEVMNYPGVIQADDEVLRKLELFAGRPIDGHSPGLSGPRLNAYVAAGIGSDHESTTAGEALDKAGRGMTVFIREGSVARDLRAILPAVTPVTERRFCFCSDDRHVPDLIEHGSIDRMVRVAIAGGIDPVVAIRMATLNAAEHFGLHDRGALAPGRRADFVVFRDLREPRAESVWVGGRRVAQDGILIEPHPRRAYPTESSVRIDWDRVSLEIPAQGRQVRVIGAAAESLITEHLVEPAAIADGRAVADPSRGVLKIAVIERHRASGRVGLGFVRGLDLQRGAIAGTVAHDHHNLIVAGADDGSMLRAARHVADCGGGLAAAHGDELLADLPLPIAGLMSNEPYAEVADRLRALSAAASDLGSRLHDPFMTLSFLALEVIPSLKLTDRGLVDVDRMLHVPLFVEGG